MLLQLRDWFLVNQMTFSNDNTIEKTSTLECWERFKLYDSCYQQYFPEIRKCSHQCIHLLKCLGSSLYKNNPKSRDDYISMNYDKFMQQPTYYNETEIEHVKKCYKFGKMIERCKYFKLFDSPIFGPECRNNYGLFWSCTGHVYAPDIVHKFDECWLSKREHCEAEIAEIRQFLNEKKKMICKK